MLLHELTDIAGHDVVDVVRFYWNFYEHLFVIAEGVER